MKAFFAVLFLGSNLFAANGFAATDAKSLNSAIAYQCLFDNSRGGQTRFAGELNLKTQDSKNFVFEYNTYQGPTAKNLVLGQALPLEPGEACVESKNVGMCLLGANDPYEFCRNQCVNWGKTDSTLTITASSNAAYLNIKIADKVKYTKTSFLVISSNESYDRSFEGKCIRQEVVELMQSLKNTIVVLQEGGEFKMLTSGFESFNLQNLRNFETAEVSVTDWNSTKAQKTSFAEIAKLIVSGKAKALYPLQNSKAFDISKVKAANCVAMDFGSNQLNSRLEVTAEKDVVVTDAAEKVKTVGQVVEVKGQSVVASHATLLAAYALSDKHFVLNGLLCSVTK